MLACSNFIISEGLLPKLQAHTVQLHHSQLSDHRILKARFEVDFMQAKVASSRVQGARWVLLAQQLGDEEVAERPTFFEIF